MNIAIIIDKMVCYMVKIAHSKRRNAMKHVKNILAGMGQALVLSPRTDYMRPSREGFQLDAKALKGDATVVAKDLKYVVMKKHGK